MTAEESLALDVVRWAREGRFADVRDLFLPQLRPMISSDALRAGWDEGMAAHGAVVSVGTPVVDPPEGGAVTVRVPVTCERGGFTVLVTIGGGQLGGIQLLAADAAAPIEDWRPPDYVDPAAFTEREVTLAPGPLEVRGTLSLPVRADRVPGLVLLGGSGPVDRDETVGRNKVFADLACGLASRGVAVLRFDKVTYAHPEEVVGDLAFTVEDEYVPHALAAIDLLRHEPGVDPDRVFVLGHSEGGTAAPRVAVAEPAVAGLVLFAAGAEPMHWAAVRQLRHLGSPAETVEAVARQARLVDSADLCADTPRADLPFGVPAAYWLDLRAHPATDVVRAVHRPILVLQGGRDYQATVDDDLARWRTALAGRADVTEHVYAADNHFFFPGSGKSTAAEYEPAQHVDPAVIDDIVAWLAQGSTRTAAG